MAILLGLDYGSARIGCAVSDADETIALPAGTMSVPQSDVIPTLRTMIAERGIAVVVVGLPLGMDGKPTAQTIAVQTFIHALQESITIPVMTVDERLTSVQAGHARGVGTVDERSAVILLQAYLDTKNRKEAA